LSDSVGDIIVITGVTSALKRFRVCSEIVSHGTEKLQPCIDARVEPLDAGFDSRVVL